MNRQYLPQLLKKPHRLSIVYTRHTPRIRSNQLEFQARPLAYTSKFNMPAKDKYTDPELREEVKKDIQNSDKGGAPGQWSARKAQFMASEYKKRGGSYNTDKKDQDESQKNLSKWSEEDWQTKEGSGNARQDDGTQKRYLPKKAWEQMSEEEKKETDEKKLQGSSEGKQHVQNTGKAQSARGKANKEESEEYDAKKAKEQEQAAEQQEEEADGNDGEEDDNAKNDGETEKPAPRKRGRPAKANGSNKKQKTGGGSGKQNGSIGSKHDSSDAPAPQASATRLPTKGQEVHWRSLPGWVSGECVDVVYEEKEIEGKKVKGKQEDPRIVMRSKNGKIAAHKPEAVYFK